MRHMLRLSAPLPYLPSASSVLIGLAGRLIRACDLPLPPPRRRRLSRTELKKRVVDSPEVLSVIHSLPGVQSLLEALYSCKYRQFYSVRACVRSCVCVGGGEQGIQVQSQPGGRGAGRVVTLAPCEHGRSCVGPREPCVHAVHAAFWSGGAGAAVGAGRTGWAGGAGKLEIGVGWGRAFLRRPSVSRAVYVNAQASGGRVVRVVEAAGSLATPVLSYSHHAAPRTTSADVSLRATGCNCGPALARAPSSLPLHLRLYPSSPPDAPRSLSLPHPAVVPGGGG